MKATIISAIALAALPSISALGINCRGSSGCGRLRGAMRSLQRVVEQSLDSPYITGHEKDRPYSIGQNVACVGGGTLPSNGKICAFLQNNGAKTQTLSDMNFFIGELLDHGCKTCGSVPTHGGNNVATGELTVNYVLNPACDRGEGQYNGGDGASAWLCYPG